MTWRVTFPCTRAEAAALDDDITPFGLMDTPPVLVTGEEETGAWRLDAYFEARPGAAALRQLQALIPSAAPVRPVAERLPEADWVAMSQAGLEPIRAGRFYIHTPAYRSTVPDDALAFEIEAGRAFGTGQHETTAGCLEALDRMKRQGFRARSLIDVGTGTGLLAFAALRLWPTARATASDIDPIAVAVTRENALANAVRLGRGPGLLDTLVAAGVDHPRIQARAPYDLVVANVLAGPLIDLAPRIARVLAPGGRLVLAGLLRAQERRVAAAYRRQGLRLDRSEARGDWPCLVLRKPRAAGFRRPGARSRARRASVGWSAC